MIDDRARISSDILMTGVSVVNSWADGEFGKLGMRDLDYTFRLS